MRCAWPDRPSLAGQSTSPQGCNAHYIYHQKTAIANAAVGLGCYLSCSFYNPGPPTIRIQLYRNRVAYKHLDSMQAHFPCKIRQYTLALINPYAEKCIGQYFLHNALCYLRIVVLTHTLQPSPIIVTKRITKMKKEVKTRAKPLLGGLVYNKGDIANFIWKSTSPKRSNKCVRFFNTGESGNYILK
jgi:hypothetical protein